MGKGHRIITDLFISVFMSLLDSTAESNKVKGLRISENFEYRTRVPSHHTASG